MHCNKYSVQPIIILNFSSQGFRVVRLEDVVHYADIVVTCTGNKNVVTREHMNKYVEFVFFFLRHSAP